MLKLFAVCSPAGNGGLVAGSGVFELGGAVMSVAREVLFHGGHRAAPTVVAHRAIELHMLENESGKGGLRSAKDYDGQGHGEWKGSLAE